MAHKVYYLAQIGQYRSIISYSIHKQHAGVDTQFVAPNVELRPANLRLSVIVNRPRCFEEALNVEK
jgi:hypothetical protein